MDYIICGRAFMASTNGKYPTEQTDRFPTSGWEWRLFSASDNLFCSTKT